MTLPTAPSRSMSQDTFDATTDAFIGALPQFETDMNALVASVSAGLTSTSTSSVTVGTGSKTFVTQSGKGFVAGQFVVVTNTAAPTTYYMVGTVTSYSGTSLVINSLYAVGSGAQVGWTISTSAYLTVQAATTVVASGTDTALTVTNSGTGNSLVVNDTGTDTTPFVIDATGNAVFGNTVVNTAFIDGTRKNGLSVESAGSTNAALDAAAFGIIAHAASAGSFDGRLRFGRSKADALGDVTAVVAGDGLGAIAFHGADGTNLIEGVFLEAFCDGTVATDVMPGRLVLSTRNSAGTRTEAIRWDSSQRTRLAAAQAVSTTFANPSAGATVTLTNATGHYQSTGTATKATLTVNLPASGVSGQICSVGFAGIITTLTVGSAGADTIRNAPTTAAADSCFEWVYNLSDTTWYRRK